MSVGVGHKFIPESFQGINVFGIQLKNKVDNPKADFAQHSVDLVSLADQVAFFILGVRRTGWTGDGLSLMYFHGI